MERESSKAMFVAHNSNCLMLHCVRNVTLHFACFIQLSVSVTCFILDLCIHVCCFLLKFYIIMFINYRRPALMAFANLAAFRSVMHFSLFLCTIIFGK